MEVLTSVVAAAQDQLNGSFRSASMQAWTRTRIQVVRAFTPRGTRPKHAALEYEVGRGTTRLKTTECPRSGTWMTTSRTSSHQIEPWTNRFWKSLFTTFECLAKLSGNPRETWYPGLKPQSILSDRLGQIPSYHFRVELAKPTLRHVFNARNSQREDEIEKMIPRADLVYGAPEFRNSSAYTHHWKLHDRQLRNV